MCCAHTRRVTNPGGNRLWAGCDHGPAVILYGSCLGFGLISFLVSAAIFTSRFANNTFDDDTATYSSLVRGWTANGVQGPNAGTQFAGRFSYPNATSTLSASFAVTTSNNGAGGSTGLMQLLTGVPDSPVMEVSTAIPSYPDSQRVKISGSVLVAGGSGPVVAWPTGFPRIDGEVTISQASSVSSDPITIKLPLAFSYTFDQYCTTVGKVTYCRCPIGDSTAGTLCIAYYQLQAICLTTDPSSMTALKMGQPPKTLGPGCAPLPLINYLNKNVQVPQVDDCYALGSTGVSVGQYQYISGSQPSSINLGVIPVTIRSQQDPFPMGLAFTLGTGQLPQSTSYQRGVAIAMWACFGVWFLFTFLWLSIGCPICEICARGAAKAWRDDYNPIVEILCCPVLCCARWHAFMLEPMQKCCCNSQADRNAAAAARLRRRSRYGLGCSFCVACEECRNGIECNDSAMKDACTVAGIPFFILFNIFAGLALTINVSQYCAVKQMCNGANVDIGCARIGDMLEAGATAKTFYALQASGFAVAYLGVAGVVLAFVATLLSLLVCKGRESDRFFGKMKKGMVALFPIGFIVGFCIYAAAGIFYYENYTTIGNDYSSSLVSVGIKPTAVLPTVFPRVFFPLGILFFFLSVFSLTCILSAFACPRCITFRIPCICRMCIPDPRAGDRGRVPRTIDGLAAANGGTPARRGSIREAAILAALPDDNYQDLPEGSPRPALTANPALVTVTGTNANANATAFAPTPTEATATTSSASAVALDEQGQPLPGESSNSSSTLDAPPGLLVRAATSGTSEAT